MKRYEKHGYGFYALHLIDSGEYGGICGHLLQKLDDEEGDLLEVGYHIMPEHWRKGYATEAAIYCRARGFELTDRNEIISIIDPENINSQGVALKNGMSYRRDAKFRTWEIRIYSVMREEWEILDKS